jgi:hypothetical protein
VYVAEPNDEPEPVRVAEAEETAAE